MDCANFRLAMKNIQPEKIVMRKMYKSLLGTLPQALTFCLAGLLCALSVVAAEVLAGSTWVHSDSVLDLPIGTVTNVNLAAGEVAEFSLPVTAGTTYTLDLASTSHAAVLVTDPEGETVGRFQAAYGMTFTASSHSTYTLSVSGNGHEPIHALLAAYTGELPFYRPAAEEERPEFMTNPCYEGAEFGYVYVPADRSPENRHSYRLAILQMPGGPEATNGPLVYLSGGPGVSAFNGAFLMAPLTNTCQVIAVNQRGAYLSQPDLFPVSPDESTTELQERLGGPEGIDFHTINTRQNAADVLDVMAALGHHEPFNLWGTSYGTMLAQEVIRQHPERIRAAVLDGVVTMDLPQWTTIAQTFLDALNALFDDVARHPEAGLLYPDFSEQFFEFAAALNLSEHDAFFNQVFHAMNLSRWGYIENLPGIIWRAARGETAALNELAAIRIPDPAPPAGFPISINMYCAVLRQDMLPFESMDAADALFESIPFPLNMQGHDYSRFQYEYSEDWAFLEPAPESFRTPVANDVPVLILNGTYDTQTGLRGARHVADHLPNVTYVEIPTVGHAVLFGGEAIIQVARDFLIDPSQPPDTTAVSGLSLEFCPPWPPDAPIIDLQETVTQSFESAGQASWHRFSAQSNLGYEIELDGATLYILDEQARILFASETSGRWTAGQDAEVHLMLVAETPGTYGLRLDRFLNEYSISLSAIPLNGGSVAGGKTYFHGDEVTVTATANTGYIFINWTENGEEVSTDEEYTFTVTAELTLFANFEKEEQTETIFIEILEGCNLISSRVAFDAKDVFEANQSIVSVWKWEGGGWAVLLPGEDDPGAYAASKGFEELVSLSPGEGFWVNTDQDQPLEMEGSISSETSVSLTQGWNLKGLKQDYTVTVNELVNSVNDPVVSLWKWADGGWAVYLPGDNDGGISYADSKGFTPLTDISPGEGFWVNAE